MRTTPILIVGYRNPSDVAGCVAALRRSRIEPQFEIFICENGGPEAYDGLLGALVADEGPCRETLLRDSLDTPALARVQILRLKNVPVEVLVHVGGAGENLGYAGGINAWLEPLLTAEGWSAVWILNPDSVPAHNALAELAAYAQMHGKGMVGSRLVPTDEPECIQCRGLVWNKYLARTRIVGLHESARFEPDQQEIDTRLDSASGASMYVTRACIEQIGLMSEGYFLYFEDLEWGLRAKRTCGIGYAHGSVVMHTGGTTIGDATHAARRSELSVYLEYRNSLLFVRKNFPRWLGWTVFALLLRVLRYSTSLSSNNIIAALRGIAAGLTGSSGRPDGLLGAHGRTGGATDEKKS